MAKLLVQQRAQAVLVKPIVANVGDETCDATFMLNEEDILNKDTKLDLTYHNFEKIVKPTSFQKFAPKYSTLSNIKRSNASVRLSLQFSDYVFSEPENSRERGSVINAGVSPKSIGKSILKKGEKSRFSK